MVESGREYVLQWPGHAAYVTERFSGLLARQTLVDVTLICDEQELKVHKLVLASCSLYFEEILAQDLGENPVILLRDLDFNILKAMIEFMYCGETTVSHTHLPSLLGAARLFKVKELESLVERMVGSHTQDHNDNDDGYLAKDVDRVKGLINGDDNGIRVSFNNKHNNYGQSTLYDAIESSDSESEKNYLDENVSSNNSDSPTGHYLSEEFCELDKDCIKKKSVSYSSAHRNRETEAPKGRLKHRDKSVESASGSSSTLDSEQCEKDSQSSLYERCYNFVNNGCAKSKELSKVYLSAECDVEVNRVGQCSRVYTHKKRSAANGDASSKRRLDKILPQPLTSNRIDLTDDSSNDETPVTLKTNLDNFTFNTESIQSIVGCSLNDFCNSSTFELLNTASQLTLERNNSSQEEEEQDRQEDRPPVLRRSVRLNPQEQEETYSLRVRSKLKDDKKSSSKAKMKLFSRTKRKNKDLERRVPNVKVILATQPSRKSQPSKSLRKTTTKTLANPKTNHIPKPEKELPKPKTTTENPVPTTDSEPVKPNTTASVNRALWGDMSDVTEVDEEFLEYSTSAEIPFAVGLLPLRAALERMQATLDHQPRKTRSSVTKHESTAGIKRKQSPELAQPSARKQQNATESETTTDENNSSAVCHIQIRTSAQCQRPRKRSLSDGAASLEHTPVTGTP